MSNQPCRYCGIKIVRWEKLPDGKYLRYDENGLHKYDICKAEQSKKYQPNHQATPPTPLGRVTSTTQTGKPYVGGTSTFPVDKEPEIRGVTINSLFIQTSNLVKEQKETNKRLETLQSIADAIAQQVALLIAKVGYPKPELVEKEDKRMDKLTGIMKGYEQSIPPERQKAYEENSKKFDETMTQIEKRTTDESGVLLKDGQEIKAVQRSLSPDEVNKALVKQVEAQSVDIYPEGKTTSEMLAQEKEDESLRWLNKTDVMQWQNISEAFVCVSCEGKFHNGFHKLGTRLCPACKDKIESNESEDRDDRSDVNQEFNRVSRSIEDINNDF